MPWYVCPLHSNVRCKTDSLASCVGWSSKYTYPFRVGVLSIAPTANTAPMRIVQRPVSLSALFRVNFNGACRLVVSVPERGHVPVRALCGLLTHPLFDFFSEIFRIIASHRERISCMNFTCDLESLESLSASFTKYIRYRVLPASLRPESFYIVCPSSRRADFDRSDFA